MSVRTDLGEPRLFWLQRTDDETGTSGTGRVVDGVQWPDGTVAIRWRTEKASTAIYDSIQDVEEIHGHGGKTVVVWHDVGTIQAVTKGCGRKAKHVGHPWMTQRGTSVYDYWCMGVYLI